MTAGAHADRSLPERGLGHAWGACTSGLLSLVDREGAGDAGVARVGRSTLAAACWSGGACIALMQENGLPAAGRVQVELARRPLRGEEGYGRGR
ncbi:hypothetical protein HRbin27_00868 [bacterium HR27]|nr:hypothetical protein HRbin27_00868 [bacterium HR27]